jgi:hypothetical protein
MPASTLAIGKPDQQEYLPYYGRYISLVSTDDVLAFLEQQGTELASTLANISEQQSESRYEAGKWSAKEVWGHVNDTERVFSYRALRISRNDKTPIEGFEQDDYVRGGPFRHMRWTDVLAEFQAVRASTVALFRYMNEEESVRRGTASNAEISVRAIAWIIAGHALHHHNVLRNSYRLL